MDGDQVRIGVYNLYWNTFGGGEQQAGGVVDALTAEHEVELIGPEPVDMGRVRERLGLQLEGVTFRQTARDQYAATLASADYDVFINHAYRSTAPNLARHGIYFVMFPHDLEPPSTMRSVSRAVGSRLAAPVRLLSGVQVRPDELVLVGPMALQVRPEVGSLQLELKAMSSQPVTVTPVRRGAVGEQVVVDHITRIDLPAGEPLVLVSPEGMEEALDPELALRITGLWADGKPVSMSPSSMAQRLEPVDHRRFLDTYDHIVSLSAYTQRWTRTWWGRDSDIISPPVRLRTPGQHKEQLIVSVGRFFGEGRGHSKRQLELVQAFRRMVETGLTGWKLVLIGGCDALDRDYAMSVRAAADGLPVEIRLNAPGAVVEQHLAAATIYWHGAGYGSDLETHPERGEHFGIAPIEAMSAGAVPVVFDAAGPAEVVRAGVDGLTYRTLDELAAHTRRLIDDPPYREQLAAAAIDRSAQYAHRFFEANVRSLVANLDAH